MYLIECETFMVFPLYAFNIKENFQICISVPLKKLHEDRGSVRRIFSILYLASIYLLFSFNYKAAENTDNSNNNKYIINNDNNNNNDEKGDF